MTLPARYCSACGRALGGELGPAAAGQAEELPSTRPPRPREPAPLTRSTGSMAIASGLLREPLPAVVPGSLPSPAPQARGLGRDVELAEPGSRLAAALVDGVFVTFLQALLLAPLALYWWTREAPRAASEVSFLPVLVTLLLPPLALLLGALYHVYFWSRRGATPGMELLELRVESEDGRSPIGVGRAALRAFGYLLCLASLGVGFLMVVFGGGLHDRIARTRVVRARPR